MDLKGKLALVTAGSAGLGAETARALAKTGMSVAINYNANSERANSLVDELSTLSDSGHFKAFRADMGTRDQVEGLVDHVVAEFGALSVIVSNHGWTRFTDFNDISQNTNDDDWDRCFAMNVKSHMWLMNKAKPVLDKNSDGGAFLMTASIAGVIPFGSSLAYSATKAAEIHLMKALASICGPKIRVNSVSPGVLETEWGLKYGEERLQQVKGASALKRLASLSDVANLFVYLAQSQSITGTNTVIDGGKVIKSS